MSLTFQYRARDALGNTHHGTLEAESADEASSQLRRDGFAVQELEEVEAADFSVLSRVSRAEIMYVTSQLALMIDTGIPLSTALQGAIDQETNIKLRDILVALRNSVEAGEDFSTALARYPKLFDNTFVSLVKASESTGGLSEMLDRNAEYLRKELETRSKVRSAMAYPMVMLIMAINVTIFLLTFVLPKFAPLFQRRGVKLPKPTIVMMAISDSLTGYWPFWVAGAIALVVGFLVGKRTEKGRIAWDWVKINAPILGVVNRKVTISRGIRTLGTMLEGGVPITEAIRLTANVSGNYFYEQLWLRVLDEVTAGNCIHDSLAKSDLFPSTLLQMITAGEETGKLEKVLAKVSDFYDREVELSVKTATSLIEPIMIAGMGIVVGGIGLALLLPIFSLSKPPS